MTDFHGKLELNSGLIACRMSSDRLQTRQRIKAHHEIDPEASIRGLAAKAKCSKKMVETVVKKMKAGVPLEDAPRSGRLQVLTGEALATALARGTETPQSSCKQVAESLRQDGIADVTPRTVGNAFRKSRHVIRYP